MAGTEAELSDPASARAPGESLTQTKETLGVDRRGESEVGWVRPLFIQTRAEEMNRFNKIMSQESKLLRYSLI